LKEKLKENAIDLFSKRAKMQHYTRQNQPALEPQRESARAVSHRCMPQ
jgi:hypothetical protein